MTIETYECPHCGHVITHAESAGEHRPLVCPHCGKGITMPHIPNMVDVARSVPAEEELYADKKARETNE